MSSSIPPHPAIRYLGVTLDCPDPAELAHFYSEALGLPITFSTDGFVFLSHEGSPGLGFYRLDDYRPPTWPDSSAQKQAHLPYVRLHLQALSFRSRRTQGLETAAVRWIRAVPDHSQAPMPRRVCCRPEPIFSMVAV
ncbi:VOC family protein [Streptomyces bobili]|uniref:VOC family protein n=1 Tax=Streptomyces bobili TaxID=67280 RepID=UPI00364B63CD